MKYWIIVDEQPCGPYELEQLDGLGLTPETPVWHSGMKDWQPASEVPELAGCLVSALERESARLAAEAEALEAEREAEAEKSATVIPPVPEPEPEPTQESEPSPEPEVSQPEAVEQDIVIEESQPDPAPEEDAPAEQPFVYRQWQQPEQTCQAPATAENADNRPMPPTYLGWSIATMLLCCLIPGVIAVIYAAKIPTLYNTGEIDKAYRYSERVEWWLQISIVLGLIGIPMSVVMSAL